MMQWQSRCGRLLTDLNDRISSRLRTSSAITRMLFGVRVAPALDRNQWDFTTLVLKKALGLLIKPGQRVLEIGVGDNAVLSIFLARQASVDLLAVDLDPGVVENARKSLANNGVTFEVFQSNIFSNCSGRFDVVFWNCPYVPSAAQQDRSVRIEGESNWDGGDDGTQLVRRFLSEAPPFLTPSGMLLLGINTFYLSRSTIAEIVEGSALRMQSVIESFPNPSKVFVLTRDPDRSVEGTP